MSLYPSFVCANGVIKVNFSMFIMMTTSVVSFSRFAATTIFMTSKHFKMNLFNIKLCILCHRIKRVNMTTTDLISGIQLKISFRKPIDFEQGDQLASVVAIIISFDI